MARNGQDLLALLAGRLGVMRKQAQVVTSATGRRSIVPRVVSADLGPNRYSVSVDKLHEADQQAQYEKAERERIARGSGDAHFESLPHVKRRRAEAARQRSWDEYMRTQKGTPQRKTHAQIIKQVDAEGAQNPGDTAIGKAVGGALGFGVKAPVDAAMSVGTYFTHAPKGTSFWDWQKNYWKNAARGYGDFASDVRNNMQLQDNAARHAAGSVGRFVWRYANPNYYGDSLEAQKKRYGYANESANRDMAYAERQRRVNKQFKHDDLDMFRRGGPTTLGELNFVNNAGVGTLAGSELATLGVGGVAKGVSKAIPAVANGVGRVAGNVAGAVVNPISARAGARVNAAVNAGMSDLGEVAAVPFRAAATAADFTQHPTATVRQAFRPGTAANTAARVMRHPGQAVSYAVHHPLKATGRVLGPTLQASYYVPNGVSMYRDAFGGNPGGAARSAADIAGFGAANRLLTPWLAIPGYAALGAFSGDGQE